MVSEKGNFNVNEKSLTLDKILTMMQKNAVYQRGVLLRQLQALQKQTEFTLSFIETMHSMPAKVKKTAAVRGKRKLKMIENLIEHI